MSVDARANSTITLGDSLYIKNEYYTNPGDGGVGINARGSNSAVVIGNNAYIETQHHATQA